MLLEFVTLDERRLILAVVVSIAVHALALTLVPSLRQQPTREPDLLQVDLVPLPPPPAPMQPIAPALPEPVELPPEPKVEIPKEPEPVVKPKPKVKAVKKPEPLKAEPLPPEPAPEPASPPPVIAAPPQPQAVEPPKFTVPEAKPEPLPPRKVAEPPPSEVIDGYGEALSRVISRHRRYPRMAQTRGWEGTVQVAIDVGAQGKISGMKIRESSGFEVLDKQALEMINAALPFPPAPPSLSGREFVVTVPIVFRLKN